MKKLLIQANNLDKVVDAFMFIHLHPGCKKQNVADYCGFSLRQVDYYTNACKYLDLIDDKWEATDLAVYADGGSVFTVFFKIILLR